MAAQEPRRLAPHFTSISTYHRSTLQPECLLCSTDRKRGCELQPYLWESLAHPQRRLFKPEPGRTEGGRARDLWFVHGQPGGGARAERSGAATCAPRSCGLPPRTRFGPRGRRLHIPPSKAGEEIKWLQEPAKFLVGSRAFLWSARLRSPAGQGPR